MKIYFYWGQAVLFLYSVFSAAIDIMDDLIKSKVDTLTYVTAFLLSLIIVIHIKIYNNYLEEKKQQDSKQD